MDEKKVREAIKYFEHLKDVLENYLKMPNPEENLGVEIVFIKSDIKIYNTAIEALEKQLPKKPIEKGIHFVYYKCPNCNRILPIDKNYCDCGQRLDWPEE